jgi:hypothetical protein
VIRVQSCAQQGAHLRDCQVLAPESFGLGIRYVTAGANFRRVCAGRARRKTREMTDNRSAAIVNGRPDIRVDIYRAGNGPFIRVTLLDQTPQLNAQQIGSYVARLSEIDHFNSSGQRLTSAAAIIRQDRANVHRYGKRDLDDESDTFFAEEGNRAVLEQMLDRGRADPGVLSRIVNGTPRIRVDIYRGLDGPFVRVTFLD